MPGKVSISAGSELLLENDVWYDLYDDDTTANFCIKALGGQAQSSGRN